MKKIKINQITYKLRHQYLTIHNLIMAAAVVAAVAWVWGSLNMMQRNYKLQKVMDDKSKELILAQLDVDKAKLEQRFYKTFEYQELAVRQRLNLVNPGEHVLVLPPNSEQAKVADDKAKDSRDDYPSSNFSQWLNFLSGANIRAISGKQLEK